MNSKLDQQVILEYFEIEETDKYEALWHLFEHISELDSVKRTGNLAIVKLTEAAIDLGYIVRYSDEFNETIEQLYYSILEELNKHLVLKYLEVTK